MATITPRRVETVHEGAGLMTWVWEGLTANDVGKAIVCGPWPDKAVQLVGTFGGNMLIEGSLDPAGAIYTTLTDPQGNPLSAIASATIEQVLEHVYLIRPSAGAGVGDVDVWLQLSKGV